MSRATTATGLAALLLGAVLLLRPGGPVSTAPSLVPSATQSATSIPTATIATTATTATSRPSPTALPPIPVGYRIQIPRLGIDLEILEGNVERDSVLLQTPEGYAFHLPGTAIPGTGANSYLYAHARRGMFLSLWDAKVGDVVWISTPEGHALKYVVSEIHPRVSPDEVAWAAPSPPERLTLQTSTGPNPGDPRFVVVALPG